MAKLKCEHERRVLVIEGKMVKKILHRSDGSRCLSRYVAIATVVFEPLALESGSTDAAENALGPVAGIGSISDIIEKTEKAKTKRQLKKRVKK